MMRVLVAVSFQVVCLMATAAECGLINAFHDPNTTSVFDGQRSGNSGYIAGTPADMIDDPSLATSWVGYAENAGTGGGTFVSAVWTLTPAEPVFVDSLTLDLVIWSEDSGTTDRLRDGHIRISYQDQPGGPWIVIPSLYRSYGPDGGDGHSGTDLIGTFYLGIPMVYGFQIESRSAAFANNGPTNGSSNSFEKWNNVELMINAVPEPTSIVMLGLGISCFLYKKLRIFAKRRADGFTAPVPS